MGKIEINTLNKISYGMYLISSRMGERFNGQIANVVFQVTLEPIEIAISINKKNLTHEFVQNSKAFSVSILSKDTPMRFIGDFGFRSGRDVDKFMGVNYKIGQTGVPIVLDNCIGYLEAEVVDQIDAGTHTIFIGKVVAAEILKDEEPMTYDYYHRVKGGKTPETAPTYRGKEAKGKMDRYVCTICGYVYDPEVGDPDSGIGPGTPFEDLPDDWVCPVCGASKDQFRKEE